MKRVKYCVNSPPAPSRYKATTQTSYGISYITVGDSSQPQYMHACTYSITTGAVSMKKHVTIACHWPF